MACDIQCQKDKQLQILQGALHEATVKKGTDPEAYEQARTAYYTLKDGAGWLHKEKERKAIQEVDPLIDSYRRKIGAAQVSQAAQSARQQAIKDVESAQVGDEDEVRFVHRMVMKEKDSANVRRRLLDFGGGDSQGSDWWSRVLDIVICFLVLVVVYFAYSYVSRPSGSFMS
jgi:hypothetical protein